MGSSADATASADVIVRAAMMGLRIPNSFVKIFVKLNRKEWLHVPIQMLKQGKRLHNVRIIVTFRAIC